MQTGWKVIAFIASVRTGAKHECVLDYEALLNLARSPLHSHVRPPSPPCLSASANAPSFAWKSSSIFLHLANLQASA